MIEIEASPLSTVERFTLTGFACPECHGGRWYWGEETDDDAGPGWVKRPCPRCGGVGELDAEVTVNWKKRIIKED